MQNLFLLFCQLFFVILITAFAARKSKSALIAWISIEALLANLFVLKPIDLWGISCSPSDAFAVGSMISLNLLQQKEGQKEASHASFLSMVTLGIFALFSKIHLLFIPYKSASIHFSYQEILSSSPRLLLASMGAFWISTKIDLGLFRYLTRKAPNRHFATKITLTALISQTIDTALFTVLGLYGLVEGLLSIFLISTITKWITAIFLGTFTSLLNPKPMEKA